MFIDRSLVATGVLAAALGFSAGSAHAQDVTLIGVRATSSQTLLEEANGFGVNAALHLSPWLAVTGGFTRTTADSEREGVACSVIRPFPRDCQDDLLAEHVSLLSLRAGARAVATPLRSVRLAAGVGASLNEVRSSSQGIDSRLPGTLRAPSAANPGGFVELGVTWNPIHSVGVVLNGMGSWVSFAGCSSEPLAYAPFCGLERITELQVGLSYRFGLGY